MQTGADRLLIDRSSTQYLISCPSLSAVVCGKNKFGSGLVRLKIGPMEEKAKKKRKEKSKVVFSGPTKKYICITCPNCCALETDGTQVAGARCQKGEAFACQEWIEPRRVITTTVRVETEKGTHILPVKTAAPVPLSRLQAVMKAIKALRLKEMSPLGSRITVIEGPEPLEIIVTGE